MPAIAANLSPRQLELVTFAAALGGAPAGPRHYSRRQLELYFLGGAVLGNANPVRAAAEWGWMATATTTFRYCALLHSELDYLEEAELVARLGGGDAPGSAFYPAGIVTSTGSELAARQATWDRARHQADQALSCLPRDLPRLTGYIRAASHLGGAQRGSHQELADLLASQDRERRDRAYWLTVLANLATLQARLQGGGRLNQ